MGKLKVLPQEKIHKWSPLGMRRRASVSYPFSAPEGLKLGGVRTQNPGEGVGSQPAGRIRRGLYSRSVISLLVRFVSTNENVVGISTSAL